MKKKTAKDDQERIDDVVYRVDVSDDLRKVYRLTITFDFTKVLLPVAQSNVGFKRFINRF